MVQFNNLNSICELSTIRICDLPRISFTFVSFAHFFATRQIRITLQIQLICMTFNNFITADRSLLHLNWGCFFFWQFVCRSIPSSSHSSRALEALSLNRGSSHDVVFVLWLPGKQISQEGQFSREAIKTQIKEQLTWMRESSALSSKFTEDGRPPLQGGATIRSDTGDATVKSALLPSIVRQHSRWLVVGTRVQRRGGVRWSDLLWRLGQTSFAALACYTSPDTYSMK